MALPLHALPRRPAPAWMAGALFSLLCNSAFILVVIALSHGGAAAGPEPLPVLHVAEMTAPPPPPAPPRVAAAAAMPPALTMPPLPPVEPLPLAQRGAWLPPPPPDAAPTGLLPLVIPALQAGAAAGGDVPVVAAPAPLTLDQPPRITAPIAIDRFYPQAARDRGITGETVLSLTVEADGRISRWRIERSTPPGVFETAVAQLVRSLRAEPAVAGGKSVTATTRLRIAWTLAP